MSTSTDQMLTTWRESNAPGGKDWEHVLKNYTVDIIDSILLRLYKQGGRKTLDIWDTKNFTCGSCRLPLPESASPELAEVVPQFPNLS